MNFLFILLPIFKISINLKHNFKNENANLTYYNTAFSNSKIWLPNITSS